MASWGVRRSFLYKQSRNSPTDYLANFDHSSLRRAKASILWFDDWNEATVRQVQILSDLGLIASGSKIIDYGCGIGRISQAILDRYSAHVVAVDRSPQMLEHAADYISKTFPTGGTIELLAESDLLARAAELHGSIDTILLIEVLQHIPEPAATLLLPRLVSMLNTDGKLFVFGNERLDVGADGRLVPATPTVGEVIARHARIVRRDIWAEGFAVPRHSFVCSAEN